MNGPVSDTTHDLSDHTHNRLRQSPGDVLCAGFGIAAAMWAVGFLTHLPGAAVPGGVVLVLLLLVVFIGGWLAGRSSERPAWTGLFGGGLAGVLNLLVLGGLLPQEGGRGLLAYAAIWIPVTVLLTGVLAEIGARIGHLTRRGRPQPNWPAAFALVACGATLLLVALGGTVTGYEAGLAVPDWPTSFGYNMFFYPLARMTGGIYYEHAHRLLGSLVGLTTLALAFYLLFRDSRAGVRHLAIVAAILVIAQGILGGLRVTEQNAAMAMFHGVLAQIFFTLMVILLSTQTRPWRLIRERFPSIHTRSDRRFGYGAVGIVLLQVITGVVLRHSSEPLTFKDWRLHLHLTLAVLVLIKLVLFGMRCWARHEKVPVIPKLALSMLGVLVLQVMLGFGALATLALENPGGQPAAAQVIVTTLHQTTGALLLALTTALLVWHKRLLAPAAAEREASRAVPGQQHA
jgi:cytochrome c oxidase assembly protein subunit 15